MPDDIKESLVSSNLTTNWHHYGISLETFEASVAPEGFTLLSTNVGLQGKTFTSTMEHATAPITTVQVNHGALCLREDTRSRASRPPLPP